MHALRTSARAEAHIALLLDRSPSIKHLACIHALVTKTGLADHPWLRAKLIALSALSRCGSLAHARSLFDTTAVKTAFLYNTLIRAYSSSVFPIESIHLYNQMCVSGVSSDYLTFPFVLKACGRAEEGHAKKGAEIHCRIVRIGLGCDLFVQNALIFMYSQCGQVEIARKVFDEMTERTVVSWNTLISAYDRCGDFESADQLLCLMPEKNVSSWNALITRYVRMGDIDAAKKVFDEMPQRDAISWNALIAGCISIKNYRDALEIFKMMLRSKIEPTELTIVSILGACAEAGELAIGFDIHDYLKHKELRIDGFVGNALIDMYAKCGDLRMARRVFDEIGMKHVTSWNAMIVSLAVHGHCEEALELFSCMEKENNRIVKPNNVTFLGVLTACSHKGLVKEGQVFFDTMIRVYGIEPDIKHYGCMVDLLSRCGRLLDAYRTIKDMPIGVNSVLWKTLLSACRVHGDVELAESVFTELTALGQVCDEDYVLMSNIYAEAERWQDVHRLRGGTIGRSILKPAGWSQIELK
ncbi:pentatricopeptide repeat-containing protein At1g74630-like [Dioscorea cayenensis subsp. rotundata]|uniref:Pentatricopeptide repeat-containing protein At1g74630-like n=1 Tax=Dioscorea cayennensis subsp. rotundata TaxID=55577 RepID=A0AB40BX56_DIOCR|nr:pentatricopeptide repeat-containing protein At1g74630-like [Dioscorea cayenensis subsp. rotundata]